ncbi:MAG: hypothetical protein HPY73_05370 [Methanomassiliicoccales archaeon]|nr:MAG: hypothetical protein HPY73_05370 [Methanomassiliicoccales archaeon]
MAAEEKDEDQQNEEFEFDCPECGTHISGGQMRCPKCGTEFVFEEVEGIECQYCGNVIPGDSEVCPKCERPLKEKASSVEPSPGPRTEAGQHPASDEEELKRQFPVYVSEVKPLMELAKEHAIDITECRVLIDKAVKAGKNKELAIAVASVKECHSLIRRKIEDRIAADIEYLEKLVQIAKGMGTDPSDIDASSRKARELLAKRDYEGALREAKNGRKISEKVTGKYVEARELYDQLEATILNSERFYVDTREARRMLKEAQDAEEHGDWAMMGILARKGKEELIRVLPDVTNAEIKRAKAQLLEAKAEGKDVSILVKVLKEAGLAVKKERYDKALEHLIEFKSELKRI